MTKSAQDAKAGGESTLHKDFFREVRYAYGRVAYRLAIEFGWNCKVGQFLPRRKSPFSGKFHETNIWRSWLHGLFIFWNFYLSLMWFALCWKYLLTYKNRYRNSFPSGVPAEPPDRHAEQAVRRAHRRNHDGRGTVDWFFYYGRSRLRCTLWMQAVLLAYCLLSSRMNCFKRG